jgi:transposase
MSRAPSSPCWKRARSSPQRVVGDKGYRSGKVRQYCWRHGSQPVLPTQSNERPQRTVDRALDRERNRVQRCITRLTHFRRVATRSEQLAITDLAMGTSAALLIWF